MPAQASLDAVTNQDAASGLKAALEKGAGAPSTCSARPTASSATSAVKIPLPDSLKKYEKLMRSVGMGKYADELVLTMNRAAEAAVPEAKKLFVDCDQENERAGRQGHPHRRPDLGHRVLQAHAPPTSCARSSCRS